MEQMQYKHTVLVVDQKEEIGASLKVLLGYYGMNVMAITSPLDMLKLVKENPFDLILLDWHMKVVPGQELLESILHRRKNSKVIVMVDSFDQALHDRIMKLGAKDVIVKNESVGSIVTTLKAALKN